MIIESVLFIHGCLVRRPVVGYLNRPGMTSNRLCITSFITMPDQYAGIAKRCLCDIEKHKVVADEQRILRQSETVF